MKRFFAIALLAAAMFTSCADDFEYKSEDQKFGTLSFAGLDITVTEDVNVVRATEADDNYLIYIYDAENKLYNNKPYTYGEIKSGSNGEISLPAGTYSLVARSASTIPAAEWEAPVYGASQNGITITAGQTTQVGTLTCRLLQCKVTVDYNDDFLAMVAGDCKVDVTVGSTLTYDMKLVNGTPSYTREAGYFDVNNGANTTMEVKFSGSIRDDKTGDITTQRMTKAFDGIAAAQWRMIKFIKKVNGEGNATFDIVIDEYVEDTPLGEDITSAEESIGEDPNQPKGDGGIKLVNTSGLDSAAQDSWNNAEQGAKPQINIAGLKELKFTAEVPNLVYEFYVDITSTDTAGFQSAVNAITVGNQGRIYLTKEEKEHRDVITSLNGLGIAFPFPEDVIGKDVVYFDLTNALSPLSEFKGNHTFAMHVTDRKGCKNVINLELVVE
ncbi:MAG: DUF4493 domain-containing protein [Alistipes sp.]|nr:DUF4493 domain-containing protein [Alistipes sp.]